jgi:hypothetical protein
MVEQRRSGGHIVSLRLAHKIEQAVTFLEFVADSAQFGSRPGLQKSRHVWTCIRFGGTGQAGSSAGSGGE